MATYQTTKTTSGPPAQRTAARPAPVPARRPAARPAPRQTSSSSSRFDEKKHPRGKAGSGHGGQFVALSYDSGRNVGTGYGSKQGDSRVRQVQEALRKLGVKDKNGKLLVVDGKYGPLTTSAVAAWQAKHGIKPANGKLTPALMRQLLAGKSAGKTGKPMKRGQLTRRRAPLKGKKKTTAKGKAAPKPPPRKPMPWEKAGRRPPANYRPEPSEPR